MEPGRVRLKGQRLKVLSYCEGDAIRYDQLILDGHVKTIWEKHDRWRKHSKPKNSLEIACGQIVQFKYNKRIVTAIVSNMWRVYRWRSHASARSGRRYYSNKVEYREIYELTDEGIALVKQAVVEDRI